MLFRSVDAGATGVGTAVEPAAGTVEGKRDERPALDTVGGTAGIEAVPQAEPEAIQPLPASPEAKKEARQILKDAGVTKPQDVREAIASHTDDEGGIDLPALREAYPPAAAVKRQTKKTKKLTASTIEKAKQILYDAGITDPEEIDSTIKDFTVNGNIDLDELKAAYPSQSTEEETESIKQEGREALRSEKGTTVSKADPTFEGFKTAQAALRHIVKTGNPFESLLADRLLRNSIGVRIVVIQPNQAVPDVIKDKFDSARGIYFEVPQTGVRTIYLHGSKFGDALQGVNARTILHEVLHAATAFKLKVGLSRIAPDSNVAQVAAGMQDLMEYARAEYAKSGAKAGIPDVAFNDVREFVTYGLTDPRMQEFLVGVKGRKETAFSRFVAYVRQLFNMGPEHQSAMSNLISMTDQLISAKLTTAESRIGKRLGPMKIEAKKPELLAQKSSGAFTEAFWKWFNGSKMVDGEGKPLVVYRGIRGYKQLPIEALNAQPRDNYAVFGSTSPYVANSYGTPNYAEVLEQDETGAIIPVYVKANKLIEFPVTIYKSGWRTFDKFEFDRRALALNPGEVLVVRQVIDIGPTANAKIDPKKLYSYPSDIFAWGKGTSTKSAIGNVGDFDITKLDILAQKAEKELKEPTTAPEKISLINEFTQVKNFDEFKELISAVVKGTASSLRPTMLGMFNMHELETLMLDNLKDANLPELVKSRVTEDTHKLLETIRKIGGDKNKALASDSELLKRLQNFQSINSR